MQFKQMRISKTGALDIEFVDSEEFETFDKLALEALEESRKSLMMSMRYLNAALWHLPFEHEPMTRTLCTNGRVMRYDPEHVLERYREDRNELVRDLLHSTLHCLLHHPFDKRHEEHDAWSIACDVAVEACAIDMCGSRFPSQLDDERRQATEMLLGVSKNLTAPALYQVLRSGSAGERLYIDHGLTGEDISRLSRVFKRDVHDLWASFPRDDVPEGGNERVKRPIPDMQSKEGESCEVQTAGLDDPNEEELRMGDRDSAANASENENSKPEAEADESPQEAGCLPQPAEAEQDEEEVEKSLEEWEKISKKVETETKAQRRQGANADSMLVTNLAIANKAPANYDEFLKRFAAITEDMCVNDDEFDYIFYTYGLERYGNMPLVEPLEYREDKRVREFVIAIDTSESCSGELVKAFVERTYEILRNQASFSSEINVHIVQCDAAVKAATKVTSLRQLEEYSDSFWINGGGGTDFKPVFEYVDSLLEEGEFDDLRGLVYFTDGYGSFPVKAPDYETAFVFVDPENMNVRVPPWAMKVLMTEDEIVQR